MARHKYNLGERVEFTPGRFDGNVPRGSYTITRQLPSETLDMQVPGSERLQRRGRARRARKPAGQGLSPTSG